MHKTFLILATCAALAGCSSIGTVNGVPVNQDARLSTQSGQGYCARQPAVCILGGVVAVGAVAYLIDVANDDGGGAPETDGFGGGCTNCSGGEF
jgi:hypothetical protein